MIFSANLLPKVLDGTKTQTRRPVRWPTGALASVDPPKPCPYKPGGSYAIQPGRGQHGIARLCVLTVDRVPVASITQGDARAEGFPDAVSFLAAWHGFYGTVLGECWRLTFELEPAE